MTMIRASRERARRISAFCCSAVLRLPARWPGGRSRAGGQIRVGPRGPTPDEPEAPRLRAQAHVLGDCELWDERRLLGDRRDSVIERLPRRAEGGRRSVEEHPTSVRRVNAGDYPAERRLARAVLSDDRVDAAPDRERYVIERTDASEVLRDALELEVGHVVRSGIASPSQATPP